MKRIFFLAILFTISVYAWAENEKIEYRGSSNYSLVERSDLRQYENGKYVGLTRREVRSFIVSSGSSYVSTTVPASGGEKLYDGNFYISQDTVHNEKKLDDGIHNSIPSVFKIEKDGQLRMIQDNGYPSFRSFPSFPSKPVNIGDKWQAKAIRCVDPLNKGIPTKMPIYVEYTYLRDEVRDGEPVYILSAKWATRYGMGFSMDFSGDKDLLKATGSNNATIYVSKKTGAALIVRDMVDETFEYSDGRKVTFKGTVSLFTEYPPAVDRSRLIPALQRAAFVSDEEAALLASAKNADDGNNSADGLSSAGGLASAAGASVGNGAYGTEGGNNSADGLSSAGGLASAGGATGSDGAYGTDGGNNTADGISSAGGLASADGASVGNGAYGTEGGNNTADGISSAGGLASAGGATGGEGAYGTEGGNNSADGLSSAGGLASATGATGSDGAYGTDGGNNSGDGLSSTGGLASAAGATGGNGAYGTDGGNNTADGLSSAGGLASAAGATGGEGAYGTDGGNNTADGLSSAGGLASEVQEPAKVVVDNTDSGIRLTVQNLHFKPDSAHLLSTEEPLLGRIASVLKEVPESQFLIEGHTASIGNPSGEMQLSLERAHAIAEELAKRGIPAGSFICRGYGGTKPVAENTTKSGMAKNRRVEITILE